MKTLWRAVLLIALGTGGFFLYQFLFPGEEAVIRKRLEDLAATVTIQPGAGNFRKGLMMEQFPRYFTRDCRITVVVREAGKRTLSGRPDMAQAVRYVAGQSGGMEVKFHDIQVTVGEGRTNAAVSLTMTMTQTAEASLSAQQFQVEMVKQDDAWLVHHAKSVETLTR